MPDTSGQAGLSKHALAPRTATGIRLRNTLLSRRSVLNWMLRQGKRVSSLDLPDYGAMNDYGAVNECAPSDPAGGHMPTP
ncbi:hypothetical protein ABT112_26015 [Streptomyces sp. NPDC002055]|uniref:hypothetical protein n=1 Tax=Streptomyces sp. NPDC002055 TaxID=3154534 RepID=UPI00332F51FC